MDESSEIPLVIIHGWSDDADSFIPLAQAIEKRTNRPINHIWLGSYISLDDDVRMNDLVNALQAAWIDKIGHSECVDVIVHSTGGLIIRDWLVTYHQPSNSAPPIRNLVMLAPANFGSPLAHVGRAVLGRVYKGFNSTKRFQTGTHILKALEMASPYTFDLAMRDRFRRNAFSAGKVRLTTIVGNRGYGGIQSLANKPGSDGTVYVSTANMNCARLEMNFLSDNENIRLPKLRSSQGKTAFLVLDEFNHSSIALKDLDHEGNEQLISTIISALSIETARAFNRWIKHCQEITRDVMTLYSGSNGKSDEYKHGYQNTVVYVKDDEGYEVKDYVIEFYQDVKKGLFDRVAEIFNTKVVSTVHEYSDNSAFRSFMIDCSELIEMIKTNDGPLRISISALPNISDEKNVVGYKTFDNDDIGCLFLEKDDMEVFFQPNRTLFVEIILGRKTKDKLFTLNNISHT